MPPPSPPPLPVTMRPRIDRKGDRSKQNCWRDLEIGEVEKTVEEPRTRNQPWGGRREVFVSQRK